MSEEAQAGVSEEVTAAPDVAVAPLPSLGEILIAARDRAGLSAGDVARTLRLGLRQIEALESNQFEVLPGNTFIRGFLRNYAKVVGGDAEAFLAAYERSRPQPVAAQIVTPTEQIDYMHRPMPRWVWYGAAAVVMAVAVPLLIYSLLQEDEPAVHPAAVSTAIPTAPARVGSNEVALALPAPAPIASGEPIVPTGDQPAGETSAPPVAAAQVPAASAAPGVLIPPAASSAPAALVLRFAGDAWVEVRDKSGNKVFSQLGRRGTDANVHGVPPFALVVGNAAQVSITYKGKALDLTPYIKVNVARLTLE